MLRRTPATRVTQSTAVLVAIGSCLAACGGTNAGTNAPVTGSWTDIVAAAEQERTVTIYSTQVPHQLASLKASFERKYPKIKVTVVKSEDTELIPRAEAEHRTKHGIGDLYVSASLPWIAEHTNLFHSPQGLAFEDPEYDKAANVADGNYFTVSAFVGAFGWNTKLFQGTIDDWPDFLDPRLGDGNIGVVKPDTVTKVGFYKYLEDKYGSNFLSKLAALHPKMYPSAVPMAAALTSGEIAAATFVEPLTNEKAAGAPVKWGVGGQPWGVFYYGMLLTSAPHPNAAQVLADFIVTREGQEAIALNAASVLPDTPGAVAKTGAVRKLELTNLTPDQVRDFQARWAKLFVS